MLTPSEAKLQYQKMNDLTFIIQYNKEVPVYFFRPLLVCGFPGSVFFTGQNCQQQNTCCRAPQ